MPDDEPTCDNCGSQLFHGPWTLVMVDATWAYATCANCGACKLLGRVGDNTVINKESELTHA